MNTVVPRNETSQESSVPPFAWKAIYNSGLQKFLFSDLRPSNTTAHLNNNDHKLSPRAVRVYIKHRLHNMVNKKTMMAGHLIYAGSIFVLCHSTFN